LAQAGPKGCNNQSHDGDDAYDGPYQHGGALPNACGMR
jgi:hypothetical protein